MLVHWVIVVVVLMLSTAVPLKLRFGAARADFDAYIQAESVYEASSIDQPERVAKLGSYTILSVQRSGDTFIFSLDGNGFGYEGFAFNRDGPTERALAELALDYEWPSVSRDLGGGWFNRTGVF